MRANNRYILDKNHCAILCDDLVVWAKWIEKIALRRAKKTTRNGVTVSTVFLGLDHNFSDTGDPILFESMIFGGFHDQKMDRCCTWNEALKMHERMCKIAFREKVSKHI